MFALPAVGLLRLVEVHEFIVQLPLAVQLLLLIAGGLRAAIQPVGVLGLGCKVEAFRV